MSISSRRHRQTAADGERLAGHEGGVVGSEEGDRAREVRRLAEASERDRLLERGGEFFVPAGHLLEERRVRRPWTDYVDGDAVARDLARQRLREADDSGLRTRVDGLARRADAPRVRGDADNLP